MSKRHYAPPVKTSADLRVTRSLRLRINEKGELRSSISQSSGEFFMTPEVLELLCLLSRQRYEGKDDGRLSDSLRHSFTKITKALPDENEVQHLLADLASVGVVVHDDATAQRATQPDGFGDPWIQWAMLADEARTQCYMNAIAKTVNEKSIVLDVGSGTGLFSATALQAGAKQVLAIEETASSQRIPELLKRLGIETEGRFKVFAGNSSEAPLPAGANVVISELFGNDPFQEGILPTLREVASRMPQIANGQAGKVRFLPESMQVFAEIIDLKSSPIKSRVAALVHYSKMKTASTQFEKYLLAARNVLDFSRISFAYSLEKKDFATVGEVTELGFVRLDPPVSPRLKFSGMRSITLQKDAELPACIIWFRAQIVEGITISSHPAEADCCEHWSPLLIPLRQSLAAKDTVDLSFELSHDEDFLSMTVKKDGHPIGAR